MDDPQRTQPVTQAQNAVLALGEARIEYDAAKRWFKTWFFGANVGLALVAFFGVQVIDLLTTDHDTLLSLPYAVPGLVVSVIWCLWGRHRRRRWLASIDGMKRANQLFVRTYFS